MNKQATGYKLVEIRLGRLNNKGTPVEESHVIAFFTAAEVRTAARFEQHYESIKPENVKEYRLENLYADDIAELARTYPKNIPFNPSFVETPELSTLFNQNNDEPSS